MAHTSLDTLQAFALDIAQKAGRLIQDERENKRVTHDYKSIHELVTSADIKSDRLITDAIRARFPDHLILSEETFNDITTLKDLNAPLWIIDPIDGTVNYAHHHHQLAISIAYAEQGQVQMGIVHCPFQNETFTATRGAGSFLNQQPIAVSHCNEMKRALIGTGFPYDKSHIEPLIQHVRNILKNCADIRRIGAASVDICWVACGRLDGFYETLKPWDFAAARLIAEEAGAQCGYFTPLPTGASPLLHGEDLLISTPELYQKLASLLQQPQGIGL